MARKKHGRGPGGAAHVTATQDRDSLKLPAVQIPSVPEVCLPASELPPALHKRYESITLIGRGGMSTVYRAKDRQLGREVALKVLFDSEDTSLRLLREARSQARLNHENACKVFEAGVEQGKRYIVMQYIPGVPFDELKPRISLEDKVRIVKCTALALHEAHRLGIVHRDVKPSNILVEQLEDGSYKPYLTDFGIARDVRDVERTATGIIAGTPAFMAPEQARGENRALDRRTDVYSLGAALYDVLAGRPPFAAPTTMGVLQQILYEEAPPVRRADPRVPVDLEAVLIKCLEKEPQRRYESARALSEDLQRFLDGEPVHARRLSPGYALLRQARKHKARVVLAGVALVAALTAAALWVRTRRLAVEQATVARELGEDVKEMELFLRNAYGLPLHDIERERDIVRMRLRNIEARMMAAGKVGLGPGHYALGRGHLALQEPEQALLHLKRASALGYKSPELSYAMGLTLSEFSTKALAAANRLSDPSRKKARLATIKAEYTEPALSHLRLALGVRLDAPAFVEGLIALHEGRPEEALDKAREAFAKAPWLYEAKKLEGDAYFASGSRFRQDAAFDYDKMMSYFQPATAAYKSAAEIARSDPSVHEGECELWHQLMNAAVARPESLRPSFESAKAACTRAIAASSRGSSAHLKLASVYGSFASWLATGLLSHENPSELIREAVARAEDAMGRNPRDPAAPYAMATACRAEAVYLQDAGLDDRSSLERAIAGYEQAIALDPSFLSAFRELASTYLLKGLGEYHRGSDPMVSLEKSLTYDRRISELDPSFRGPGGTRFIGLVAMAEYLIETGRDPGQPVKLITESLASAKARSPDWPFWGYYHAYSSWLKANYELASNEDPSPSLSLGMQSATEQVKRFSASPSSYEILGKLTATRALYLLQQGNNPEPALREARDAFQHCLAEKPWDLEFNVWRSRVELIHLRWLLHSNKLELEAFAAAAAPLQPLLEKKLIYPNLYQTMAEIYELEAGFRLGRGLSAEATVTSGLTMAAKALAINPNMATALASRGRLLLLRARAGRDLKTQAASEAERSLSAAVQKNRLLGRELEPLLRELRSRQGADPAAAPSTK